MTTGVTEISRRIIISQPITDSLAGYVIDHITAINDFDNQMSVVSTYQPEPIEIFINSGGGSATAGNAIITTMEMSETPIITYGLGMVGSMALAIFVSGDIRIASRFCRFMYHTVAYGMEGNIKDHEDAHKEAGILQEMYNSLFLERTKLSQAHMDKIRKEKKDFFFSGKRAVKLGVADKLMDKPEKKFDLVTEEEYEQILKELEQLELEK